MDHPIRMDDLGVPVFQKTSKSLYPYAPWCWYIHLRTVQNWVILLEQMLVNIPAPWSIWA